VADTTRLDELTEQWQARGLKYDDAAEFINLLLERLDGSGPENPVDEAPPVHEGWRIIDRPADRGQDRGPDWPDAKPKCDMECENVYSDRTCPIGWRPPSDLDHLEILAERRESILYKLLTNSGRQEDLLREMLESLGRIEESLIVAKPPSWKECDHAWVETTGGKRCTVCGVCIMPRLT
jgi:hypothetical protein